MKQKEFEMKLRRLAFLVLGFIAWALVLFALVYVLNSSGILYGYRILIDVLLFVLLILGVYFVFTRIYALVFVLEDKEETQEV